MRYLSYVMVAAAVVSLAGCSDKESATQQTGAAETASASATNAGGQRVELLTTPTAPDAFPLNPGSFVSGAFKSPRPGTATSFSVQIGNYSNTVDGSLVVKLCQKDVCKEGSADLTHSVDNRALEIALNEPLNVSTDEPITFTLTKTGGAKQVAVWTYAPDADLTELKVSNGTTLARAPNIALTFSK